MRIVDVHAAVIIRAAGRSSIPRTLGLTTDAGDYWMPAFAGMTAFSFVVPRLRPSGHIPE
jgi:hypothetical protein